MTAGNENYRIVFHAKARLELDAAIVSMLKAGTSKTMIKSLVATLEERISRDPHDFGERQFTVAGTNVIVALGFVRPLAVEIGIHDATRVVLVRSIFLMSES